MKTLSLTLSVICALAFSASSAYAARLASAKVTSVTGTATAYAEDGTQSPLKIGDIITTGASISVTAQSSAGFVFSNGSEIMLSENTSVSFVKLEQEAFSGSQSYEALQADPSKSQTLLELNYGNLDFHVKRLKSGSNFNVETPLGTAAVRGTKGSVGLRYSEERGEFILKIFNLDGLVDVSSRYGGGIEYNDDNLGDKRYDSSLSSSKSDAIPKKHTVVIRVSRLDPFFDALFDLLENYIPEKSRPGKIKIPGPELTPDDPGIIVISPEGPAGA